MSHCASNCSLPCPMSSKMGPCTSQFTSLHPQLRNPVFPRNLKKKAATTMAAGEGRGMESLGPLQRSNKQQSQQPNKRLAPVTPVGLWDRFPTARTVQQMLETMDRVFEDPSVYTGGWSSALNESDNLGYRRGRTPWEIKEGEADYKMRFDMPGMTKEDVKVWVEEKMLVVKSEKKKLENEDEEVDEEWPSKSYGRYSCRIALPDNAEIEKIKAEVKDGVLYINIPKATNVSQVFDVSVQ